MVNGVYLQRTSSEQLMQTVSALDLAREPLRSLWYLHIQPPLFDAIRMVAAVGFEGHPKRRYQELVVHVDRWVYRVWAGIYVLVVGLAGFWLGRLTRPWFGVVGALLGCAAHPAMLFYATFLDSTMLGIGVTAWLSYEVWALQGERGSVTRLSVATMLAVLARSHFQWPLLVVVATAMWWRRAPRRRIAAYLLATGLFVSLYVARQYLVFGLTTSSSFAGDSGCKSIRAPCQPQYSAPRPGMPDPSAARVLNRTRKPIGTPNFNHIQGLLGSFRMMQQYREYLLRQPIRRTMGAYLENLQVFLQPSSSYARHALVDRLPWRGLYDRVFSGGILLVLLAGLAVFWLWPRGTRLERLALALPCLYVAGVSVVFEYKEGMRYKAFIEPALVIALGATAYRLAEAAPHRLGRRPREGMIDPAWRR